MAKDINDTGKAIADLDKTLAGTLKEAEKLVGSPSSAKPTATKNAKKDKTGSTTAKKTSKEPTKDSSDGQKSGGSAQRGKTAPAMRSGGTTSDHIPKNSGAGNSGKGTAQKTADKQSDKKTQDAKGHGLRNPAKSHNLAAGDEQGYVETDAQEMSYEMPLFNFGQDSSQEWGYLLCSSAPAFSCGCSSSETATDKTMYPPSSFRVTR